MTTDTMAMFGLFAAMTEMTRKPTAVVPEPEFARFVFPDRKAAVAARAWALAAANDPAAPHGGARAA
jgi:hypothetical protein